MHFNRGIEARPLALDSGMQNDMHHVQNAAVGSPHLLATEPANLVHFCQVQWIVSEYAKTVPSWPIVYSPLFLADRVLNLPFSDRPCTHVSPCLMDRVLTMYSLYPFLTDHVLTFSHVWSIVYSLYPLLTDDVLTFPRV